MKTFQEYVNEGDKCEQIEKQLEKLRAKKADLAGKEEQYATSQDPRDYEQFKGMMKNISDEIAKGVEAKKEAGCK